MQAQPLIETRRAAAPGNEAMLDAVRARHSVRTFTGEPLRPEHLDVLRDALADPARLTGPLGRRFRIALLTDVDGDRQIGTYGYTRGFRALLVAIARPEPLALFELAYVLHGLVLQLTHLGVASVWMGGAFNPADVREATGVAEDEVIAAIIPLGYASGRKRLIDYAAPVVLKATRRKPMAHSCFIAAFGAPLPESAGPLYGALEVARRAPSAKNRQPWRAVVSADGARIHLYAAFSLRGEVGTGRKQYACPPEYLDLGCFYRSLEIALAAAGLRGRLTVEDPGLEARPGEDIEYLVTWTRAA